MTRKEFFEWLDTCPSHKWGIVTDFYGKAVIYFQFTEEEEEDES